MKCISDLIPTVCPLKESGHLMEDYLVDTQYFGKISSGYWSDTNPLGKIHGIDVFFLSILGVMCVQVHMLSDWPLLYMCTTRVIRDVYSMDLAEWESERFSWLSCILAKLRSFKWPDSYCGQTVIQHHHHWEVLPSYLTILHRIFFL